jgi:hypothetical protein
MRAVDDECRRELPLGSELTEQQLPDLFDPDGAHRIGHSRALGGQHVHWLSFETISSGLCLFFDIFRPPSGPDLETWSILKAIFQAF